MGGPPMGDMAGMCPTQMMGGMGWGDALHGGGFMVDPTGAAAGGNPVMFPGATHPGMVGACGSGAERAIRQQNGWTVVWIGERAFRAPAAMKEQIEAIGFQVKIYRSHDKCCRALDKKSSVASNNAFVVSEADSEPLLAYLRSRKARRLHIVVDADSSPNPVVVQRLATSVTCPEESSIVVASHWEEVLAALRDVGDQVALLAQAACGEAASAVMAPAVGVPDTVSEAVVEAMPAAAAMPPPAEVSDAPWTLVWVSDQAFKPAAGGQKTKLEALGCQVKGYKTHRNAARALDKKRALVRTVVLVCGAEAAPLLAYLSSRPEIGQTPVVVEGSSRLQPVRESPSCKVVEDFECALHAVAAVAADPGFL